MRPLDAGRWCVISCVPGCTDCSAAVMRISGAHCRRENHMSETLPHRDGHPHRMQMFQSGKRGEKT